MNHELAPSRFIVLAPATTANLGPGFDCAGAALDLWNELDVSPALRGEPLVTVEGEGSDEVPARPHAPRTPGFALGARSRVTGSTSSTGSRSSAGSARRRRSSPRASSPGCASPAATPRSSELLELGCRSKGTPTTWPPRSPAASA